MRFKIRIRNSRALSLAYAYISMLFVHTHTHIAYIFAERQLSEDAILIIPIVTRNAT